MKKTSYYPFILTSIQTHQSRSFFSSPIHIQINIRSVMACMIGAKVTYIPSANQQDDQIIYQLKQFPLMIGNNLICLNCNPPNIFQVPHQLVLGICAIVIELYYKNEQFIRVGIYVDNYLSDGFNSGSEMTEAELNPQDYLLLQRNIMIQNPKITYFNFKNQQIKKNTFQTLDSWLIKNKNRS